MAKPVLHQFLVGATPGDAITDYAMLLRRWLREAGFRSEIYAESIAPKLEGAVHSYLQYRPASSGELVVLHHSIGSDVVDHLLVLGSRILLIYHNITPVEFFKDVDPRLAAQIRRGRKQLALLCSASVLGLGVSEYDARELSSNEFERTGVLPLVLDESRYAYDPNPGLMDRYSMPGPNLLFVGRLAPNKRQDDLVKLLYYTRRVLPQARLFLVGSHWMPDYASWLEELATDLGVQDAVVITGHVDQRDLVTYYRLADYYVSMSEHEGFGKPFIESMYFGVPILAYAAAAVPETLGGTGVLFNRKDFEALAEIISLLAEDGSLRHRTIARQKSRVARYLAPTVRLQWFDYLTAPLVGVDVPREGNR